MPDDFDPQICPLCWETFENKAALDAHEEAENSQTYALRVGDDS